MSQAIQQNFSIAGTDHSNDKLSSKTKSSKSIKGSDLFKELLSQKISYNEESKNDLSSQKTIATYHERNDNNNDIGARDMPDDIAIQLKPKNISFEYGTQGTSDVSKAEYSISVMGAEAIRLQEQIHNGEIDLDFSISNDISFDEMINNSPLIYHVNFAVDTSEMTQHLSPEEYAQPVEILSCEASAQPFIFAPETPLAALGDWQINYLQNPSTVESDVQSLSMNTRFLVNEDNSSFADVKLMNHLEDSFKLSGKNDISTTLEVSPDFQLNNGILQIFNSYNATLSEGIESIGQNNFAAAIGKQVSNVISNVSMNVLKSGGIEVSLYPENLGHVKITCNIGEKTEVHIAAEKMSTLTLLQQNADSIKETLLNSAGAKTSVDIYFNQRNQSHAGARDHYKNVNIDSSSTQQLDFEKDIILYFSHDGIINCIV